MLDARNVKAESSNTKSSSNAHRFFMYAKNTLKTTVQSICNQFGYETFGINNLPSVIFNLLSEIIECNLEIGFVDQAEYYIDILRNITGEDFEKKLSEYELRKELIVQLRQILEFETALLSTQEDDIQCFIVKKPENRFQIIVKNLKNGKEIRVYLIIDQFYLFIILKKKKIIGKVGFGFLRK